MSSYFHHNHTTDMHRIVVSLIAAIVGLFPSLLFCEGSQQYQRAEQLVRQVLNDVSPPADAVFQFTQTRNRLAHLSKPWQTWRTSLAGTFLLADEASAFYQIDSTTAGANVYTSYKFCCDTLLAIVNYGETAPRIMTVSGKRDFLYTVSQLTPVFLLKDFLARDPERSFLRYVEGEADSVVYLTDDGVTIAFAIDRERKELQSVSVLYCDDMYGDVTSTLLFTDYTASKKGDFRYPTTIIERELGINASKVSVTAGNAEFDREQILAMIPPTYRIAPDPPTPVKTVAHSSYTPQIHLLDMEHTQSRTLVVEFKDFLLVTGVPLSSENGELVINKAHEIAPQKPIRYIVPGHHHPHYVGGIRPFVHKGTTVVVTSPDSAYLRQLTTFPHTLEPDSLQLEPRPLLLEAFDGERTITDGELELQLIDIGKLSNHTDNFLIYYFPQYKLLFQDELIWIATDKPLEAATPRQKGLYDAIVQHNLDVETILQGWPLDGQFKSVIPFDELKRSVEMIEE